MLFCVFMFWSLYYFPYIYCVSCIFILNNKSKHVTISQRFIHKPWPFAPQPLLGAKEGKRISREKIISETEGGVS